MRKSNGAGKTKTREIEERELPVKLTLAELLKRADSMAAAELEIEQLQIERTTLTRKINDVKKTRAELAHTIERGSEDRKVRCAWHEDFPKNVFRLKREDTHEEVDTRPMTADDRTGNLFAGSPTPPPPPRTPRGKRKTSTTSTHDDGPTAA